MRALLRRLRPAFLVAALVSWAGAWAVQEIARPNGFDEIWNPGGFFDWSPSFFYALGFGYLFLGFRSRTPVQNAFWVIAGALGYEALQALIPERTVDVSDFIATIAALPAALIPYAIVRGLPDRGAREE